MTNRFPTLTAQLMLLVLAAMLPIAGLVGYELHGEAAKAESGATALVRELVRDIVQDNQTFIENARETAIYLASRPAVRALDPAHCDPLIAGLDRMSQAYTAVILVDEIGRAVCWSLDQNVAGVSFSDREWFRNGIRSSGFHFGSPVRGRYTSEWSVPLTVPIRDDAGRNIGVLNTGIGLREIARLVRWTSLPAGSEVTILGSDGAILAHSAEPEKWLGKPGRELPAIAAQRDRRQGVATLRGADGVERINAFATIPDYDWLVSASVPLDAVMASYRHNLAQSGLLGGGVVLLVLVVTIVLAGRIRSPIHSLEQAAHAASRGNLGVRAAETGPREIATVAREFNLMLQARARAEAVILERSAQLEAANKELESFSYSVSHDLRTPLRAIDGFSEALLQDYSGKLGAEGQDCLRRVRAASQRMGMLIDDMLKLSRATRDAMKPGQVDLTGIANSVAAELRESSPARNVTFQIAPEVTARGDARLLRIVLENLMGNAWKFSGKRAAAQIEFGAARRDGEITCFVRDDGAGFDMAFADNLFLPFQRLHTLEDFSGSGIGLATVKRIVSRHGGRVWAEGAVDKGATFYFTLPEGAQMAAARENGAASVGGRAAANA